MGSAPKPPDPYATAAAQTNANVTAGQISAIMNNPSQYSPGGSRVVSQTGWQQVYDPNTGKYIQTPSYKEVTKLSPGEQKIYNYNTTARTNLGATASEQSAKLRQLLASTIDTSGLQDWSTGQAPGEIRQDQGPTDRAAIESAMMSRWSDDAQRSNAAQEAQLAARGLAPGSQGWGDVQQQQTRARTDAVNQAYLASGQESRAAQQAYNAAEQQRYAEGSDYSSFLNNLRQGQLQERLAMRNQPINEITALLGGAQVAQPQFQPFSRQGINPADVGGYIQQNYGQQSQQYANMMQGLFGLGSAGIYGALTV